MGLVKPKSSSARDSSRPGNVRERQRLCWVCFPFVFGDLIPAETETSDVTCSHRERPPTSRLLVYTVPTGFTWLDSLKDTCQTMCVITFLVPNCTARLYSLALGFCALHGCRQMNGERVSVDLHVPYFLLSPIIPIAFSFSALFWEPDCRAAEWKEGGHASPQVGKGGGGGGAGGGLTFPQARPNVGLHWPAVQLQLMCAPPCKAFIGSVPHTHTHTHTHS